MWSKLRRAEAPDLVDSGKAEVNERLAGIGFQHVRVPSHPEHSQGRGGLEADLLGAFIGQQRLERVGTGGFPYLTDCPCRFGADLGLAIEQEPSQVPGVIVVAQDVKSVYQRAEHPLVRFGSLGHLQQDRQRRLISGIPDGHHRGEPHDLVPFFAQRLHVHVPHLGAEHRRQRFQRVNARCRVLVIGGAEKRRSSVHVCAVRSDHGHLCAHLAPRQGQRHHDHR